jgi:hypothetical protein
MNFAGRMFRGATMRPAVADIQRALDKAAQAVMTLAVQVRGDFIDAARLDRI